MKKLFFVIVALSLSSCFPDIFGKKDGRFLNAVVPLSDFNSEFDDYNSNIEQNRYGHTFITFSSKRDRKDKLNLVYFPAEFSYNKHLELGITKESSSYDYFRDYGRTFRLAAKVNGNFNVFGPKTISFTYDLESHGAAPDDLLLFYADDSEGNMEIKYTIANTSGFLGPFKFDLLNSPKDDGYPSFSYYGDKIYFSSNREGTFDIYELSIPRAETEQITVESLVNPEKYTLRKVEELSSPYEDKCPYFWNDMMVFVSDRPGGMGGQDIYYARFENGKWSEPFNAGDRINTPSNEYRPILPNLDNFNYRLMIFSSDRPFGKKYSELVDGVSKQIHITFVRDRE